MGIQLQLPASPTSTRGGIGARLRKAVPDVLVDAPPWVLVGYALLTAFVIVYVMAVAVRDGRSTNVVFDGWAVVAAEIVACALCFARLVVSKPPVRGRGFVLALGAGMLSWALGDTIAAVHFSAAPPVASELCYLGFYPLGYIAIVILMRQEVSRFPALSWLDGALAGLGAAAVCAAFAFKDLLRSTHGSTFTTATNLAFPIGDVLLLALVVGGTAMMAGRMRTRWLLVALACTVNAVGDTFNLLHNSVGASPVGQAFNATAWPVAILLMSLAIWTRSSRRGVRDQSPAAGFVLPGLSAVAGLVILTVGTWHSVGKIALGLATATLAVAGTRLAMSVGTLREITEQRHRQAITDELTGLGNRRHLSQLFDALVTASDVELLAADGFDGATRLMGDTSSPTRAGESVRPAPGPLAVLFVDLDRFKEVNDSFGHTVGDELLRQIGPRLTATLRRGDSLVRLGGDEFAVVLPATDEHEAFQVAKRLAASLEEPFQLDLVPVQISASVGIALAPRDGADLNDILRCADAAMYRAKLSHVHVQIYDQAFDDGGDILQLADELRHAVENGGLVLHYQPLLDLKTGMISAVEALLRWEHPRLGTIPPLKFLPLAEELGLMPAVTVHVLNNALRQCSTWRNEGHDLAVSVNISASNLLDPGFVETVAAAIQRWGTPPEVLVLEITETCIISDYQRSRDVIERLQRLGVVMSIDDFGAGFTSLAHLSNLAVGELKLDRAFIAPLGGGDAARDVELVRSTIGLGHALGLRVVAEGIETSEILAMLSEFGCDIAQGFLISKPVPPEQLQLAKLSSLWRDASAAAGALSGTTMGPPATNGSSPA